MLKADRGIVKSKAVVEAEVNVEVTEEPEGWGWLQWNLKRKLKFQTIAANFVPQRLQKAASSS